MDGLKASYKSDLEYINNIITDKKKRIDKLFDTIETSDMDISDITPRIKKLNSEIEKLEEEKTNLESGIRQKDFPDLSDNRLKPYIKDFIRTLNLGSIFEQKSFIRSFIHKIWIDYPTATIEYTIPINNDLEDQKREVLALTKTGSPGRTRTYNISVNSRTLYR